jgi:hypothetical protein
VSKAAEALRSAALETREAAWKDGIDPDGPLGAWVRSQERSLTAQALMHDEQEARVKTVKETVDGQVEVLKTGIAPVRWTVCRLGGYVSVRAAFLSAS